MFLQDFQGIFIVEDNLIYQQMIARELESFGVQFFFYTTGEHCIANLCRRPSIVVLDYNLDGEINGLETLKRIKSDPKLRDIPVVMMTGVCGEEEMQTALVGVVVGRHASGDPEPTQPRDRPGPSWWQQPDPHA